MSSYHWAECINCNGRGKKWPHGAKEPAVRCEACRGIGRVCTQPVKPGDGIQFDGQGRRIPGVVGMHPLGDCMDCCGMVTTVIDELTKTTAKTLDQADQLRSQQRGFREQLVETGEGFEERLKELESGQGERLKELESGQGERLKELEAKVEELGGSVGERILKRLGAGKKGSPQEKTK